MSQSGWLDVSRNNACSRCKSSSWCARSTDGRFEVCRRVNDGSGVAKVDKNGDEFFLYRVGETSSIGKREYRNRHYKSPDIIGNEAAGASPSEKDQVYSKLIEILGLSSEHRSKLIERGLTEAAILSNGYASMPRSNRADEVNELIATFGADLLLKIPGFYKNENGRLKLAGPPGLIIPVRNHDGDIVALKVRRDESNRDGAHNSNNKYLYVSSAKMGGCGPGACVHVSGQSKGSYERVRVTEGELKADVATLISGVKTISLPGVGIWRKSIAALRALKAKTVILAIDSDASTNRKVATPLKEMSKAFRDSGFKIEVETWDRRYKGIDDALLGQAQIITHIETEALQVIERIFADAVSEDPTEEETSLKNDVSLLEDASKKVKANPGVAVEPTVLRAAIRVQIGSPSDWINFRGAVKRAGVPLRVFEAALSRERAAMELDVARNRQFKVVDPVEVASSEVSPGKPEVTRKYEVIDGATYWNKKTANDTVSTQLANFSAKIVAEEVIDDGVEPRKVLVLEGQLVGGIKLPVANIQSIEFASMNWVIQAYGAQAICAAGMGTKDHLRAAIQELSGKIETKVSFGHTGFRRIDEKVTFLFAGGAITADDFVDSVRVDLETNKMKDFRLPPPSMDELPEAVCAVLAFLEVAPKRTTMPLLAAVFRAPLGELLPIDFSVFLYGESGTGKSELAAILQSFFGPDFHSRNLPGNFAATANALEFQSSILKDVLFVIDDFAPQPNHADALKLAQTAERLFRGAGNRAGRARLSKEIKQRAERFPRGLILATGEDLPRGTSVRARLLIVEADRNEISFDILTRVQALSRSGAYAGVMSSYIQWICKNFDELSLSIPKRHILLRQENSKTAVHRRSPDIAASLTVGFEVFLRFCAETGAVNPSECMKLQASFLAALEQTQNSQACHQRGEDPVSRFFELLSASITSGRAHLVEAKRGGCPHNPGRYGWRVSEANPGKENPLDSYQPRGEMIGWLPEGNELYLEPSAAFAVVQRLATEQKAHFTLSEQTLWKQMNERKLLVAGSARDRLRMRKTVGGGRPYVIVVRDRSILSTFGAADSDDSVSEDV